MATLALRLKQDAQKLQSIDPADTEDFSKQLTAVKATLNHIHSHAKRATFRRWAAIRGRQDLGLGARPRVRTKNASPEKNKGGWKTQGRGKHTIKPLPQNGLDPPTYDTFSLPVCSHNVISLEGTGTDQTNPTFGTLQNWLWRAHSMVRFPPKNRTIRFAPPLTVSQLLRRVPRRGGGVQCLPLGPFCGSKIVRFSLVRSPVEVNSVCKLSELQGQKWSSAWCGSLNGAF